MKNKFLSLIIISLLVAVNGFAQVGALDNTFSAASNAAANNTVSALAYQTDGKIIIGGSFTTYDGSSRNRIVRINNDGTLDASFNPGTGASNSVSATVLQPDGRIIIGGSFTTYNGTGRNGIARITSNGALDVSFNPGTGGTGISAIALQPDGKIIIGGNFTTYNGTFINRIARLNSDGTLDGTFNPGTGANGSVLTINLQPDGKVIIGGVFSAYNGTSSNRIARLNSDGTLDVSFTPGTGGNGSVSAISIQSDGKIIIGGGFTTYNGTARNRIARINIDGTLDVSFDPGTGANNTVNTTAFQPDGKIIIGGGFGLFNGVTKRQIARLNSDGSIDNSYFSNDTLGLSVNAIFLQPDGKHIIGGNFTSFSGVIRNRVARVNPDGSLDAVFNTASGANGTIRTISVQPDGKIFIGGDFTVFNDTLAKLVARLNSNGSLDASFNPGTGANFSVQASAIQPDGKIIIGGSFTTYNGTSINRIARLNSDGTLDVSFNPGTGANGNIGATTLQPDGKIIIGGFFSSVNGTSINNIARLNSDGTLDTSFNPGAGSNSSIAAIAIQPDGKIIIGGFFTTYNGTTINRIARINSDGTLDGFFSPGTAANSSVSAITIQPDGKLIIAGGFTTYNGTARNRIARINSDGTLDVSFNPGTAANSTISALIFQSDGKIIIGGDFTTYNGLTRNRIARLNNDGTPESTFTQGGVESNLLSMAQQSDGKIIIGGNFSTYGFINRNRIARIKCSAINSASISTFKFCPNESLAVSYSVSGIFPAGNVFTVQMSTGFSGSFANPVIIGSVASTVSGTINAVIPANLPVGIDSINTYIYFLRVICSDPAITEAGAGSLQIKLSAGSDSPICLGDTLHLTSLVLPDTLTPSFSWTGPNGFTSALQNPVRSNITPGDTGIYTVTSNNGCSASVTVSSLTSPIGFASSNSPVCTGETLQLNASGGDTYSWTGPNGFTASGSSASKPNFAVSDTGTYTVTVSLNACSVSTVVSTHVNVTVKPIVSFSGLNSSYCINGTASVLTGLPSGGTFSGGNIVFNVFTPVIAGSHVIKYYSLPYFGCPVDSTVQSTTVYNLPALIINSSAGNVLCPEGSTVLTAVTSASSFQWNTGSTANSVSVNEPDTISVTVTDNYSCSNQSSIIISNDAVPHLTSNNSGSICPGDIAYLSFTNVTSVLWSMGATTNSISVSPSVSTTYYVQGVSANGCTYNDSIRITVNPPVSPGPVTNMLPADSTPDLSLPLSLSWFPGIFNTKYDIYIWPDGQSQPANPFVGNYTSINLTVSSGLTYGVSYSWRIVSKNGNCFSTAGPIQHFTITQLPDLQAQNIQFPSSVVAGQSISVSWQVHNAGNAATGTNQWNDAIFLSADTILDFDEALYNGGNVLFGDRYIYSTPNFSALLSGQTYSNSATYYFPIDAAGSYYLFIISNAFHQLNEADTNITLNWTSPSNNIIRSTSPISVSIPPLPDLRVTSIVNQNNAFSGDTINVTYSVKNFGTGSTGMKTWYDGAWISDQPILDTAHAKIISLSKNFCGQSMGLTGFQGNLLPDSSYTHTIKVLLPKNIFGQHFIFIGTDVDYQSYEGPFESNNLNSNPIQVFLTPPPDLAVTDITSPSSASNGQQITVTWTIKNQGLTPSNELINDQRALFWKDALFMTTHPNYDLTNALTVVEESFYHDGYVTIIDPEDLIPHSGSYINTGYRRFDLCELESKIEWHTANINGMGCSMYDGPWTNSYSCGLCDGPCAIDLFKKYYFKRYYDELLNQPVNPDQTYTISAKVYIPENLSGDYYFYLKTDALNQIFEYNNEGNNILRSDTTITISKPDLQVTNVTAPSVTEAGSPVTIQWQVNNPGNGSVTNHIRKDYIFLCTGSVFNLSNTIAIDSVEYTESIPAGTVLNKQKTVTLPNTLTGTYRVFVFADFPSHIFETNENNNVNTSAPVMQINLTTWADLSVSSFNPSNDTLQSVVSFPLIYSVVNSGTREASGSWIDSLFISKKSSWNLDSSYFIGKFMQSRLLASSGSYSENSRLSLPLTQYIPHGTDSSYYFFYLITDAGNTVFENTSEGNNIFKSSPVFVFDRYVDHIVTQVSGADTTASGASYQVQWTVKNTGNLLNNSYYSVWYDDIYLSSDTILNAGDASFARYFLSNPLNTDATYTINHSFNIPNGLSGDFYVIGSTALVDKISGEKNRTNNTNLLRDISGVPKTIHINATPAPDLKVTLVNAPSQAQSGQPIKVVFTIKNDGPGNTVPGNWENVIYLSNDFSPSSNEILKVQPFTGGLNPGVVMTDSVQVFLPVQANGNYFLIVSTDKSDVVYEENNNNNLGFALITVIQPPPCDLIPANIVVPDSAITGQPVTVTWQVANNSINPATGFTKESVYFSKDSLWDIGDPLLGIVSNTINIAPGFSESHTLTADLAGTATGYHHVLVRADLLDNIFESNENNNISSSSGQVFVTVKNLPLNVVTPDVLVNNEFLYYKFDAADTSLFGETLLVTLKGDSINGINEMYASFEEMPTRASFDFSFINPVSGNQELVIPALGNGNYYFAVYGHTVTVSQNITLLAQILPFEIRKVNADKGGNTGNVTVKITGSKFIPSMQAHLQSNSSALDISASAVSYVNSTTVFATFPLNQKPLGIYDLKLVKPDSTVAILDNSFEIEAGNTGTFYVNGVGNSGMSGDPNAPGCDPGAEAGINQSLQLTVNAPVYVNIGRVIPMQISFGNAGNVDIPIPTRILVCSKPLPLAFDVPSLAQNKKELYIEFEEPGGPPGILRAGASATITLFSKATSGSRHEVATFKLK